MTQLFAPDRHEGRMLPQASSSLCPRNLRSETPRSSNLHHTAFDTPALDNLDAAICPTPGASPRIKIFFASKTTKPAPLLTSHHVKSHQITTVLHLRTTIQPSATILFSTEVPMFGLRHSPLVLLALALSLSLPAPAQEVIQIDAHAHTTPFPHFWE